MLAGGSLTCAAQETTKPAPAPPQDRSSDERAIRQAGEAFVRAYNEGDAGAIAAMFTDDAEVIDEQGQVVAGRPAIQSLFASTFAAHPGETIVIDDVSLRFLGPDVAKEEGRARVVPAGSKPGPAVPKPPASPVTPLAPRTNRYSVLYVRQDGRWLQSSVREHADTRLTPHERLEPLAWLVGVWVDETSSSIARTSTRWSDDGNFLLVDVTIQVEGRPALLGTQRIGWDPLTQQVMSWAFDSDGGHGVGLWAHDGNRWVVKSTRVLSDGRTATSTQVYTLENPHLVRWKSIDRTVGSQVEPDLPELVMVRKPPRPR
jgi:uncharacterized protein (TIGR02246 family)